MGVTISNHELIGVLVVVGGNMLEDDSLWESFPQALETLEGVRRYISAFRVLLQELSNLNPQQVHALRACSVLAICPSTERTPPSGGFPTDLSELNLSGWAALVQDMVAGLQVVPPNLVRDVGLPVMVLLQLLEVTTGVGFCHFCCRLGSWCKCMGAYQQAPSETWSQIVEQTPGYGVTASSGGMATPSTTVAGMYGYVAPLPGLTPPDFSNWSLPPSEVPLSRGLPAASQGLPGIGRSDMIRSAVERHARVQWVPGPLALAQRAKALPMLVLHAPQVAPPLHQPRPSWAATPYQQVVQPPGKSTGREPHLTLPLTKLPPRAVKPHSTSTRQLCEDLAPRPCVASSEIPYRRVEEGPWVCAQGLL